MKVNQETFLKLYEPVHESFARFCHAKAYGLVEAEDLIAETITCALENFHTLKNEKAFLSFLFSIASNLVNKQNRRLKFKGDFDENLFSRKVSDELNSDQAVDIKLLYQAIEQLPTAMSEAIILFEISGFSIKEVSKIQNASTSAIKQRLKRGRMKLAKLLGADELLNEPVKKRSTYLASIFLSF